MAFVYHLIWSHHHGMPWSWLSNKLVTRMMHRGWFCVETSVLFPCRFSGKWDGRKCWDSQRRKVPRDPSASGNDWYGGTEFGMDPGERRAVHQVLCVMCSIEPSLQGRIWCLRLAQLSLPKEVLPKLLPQHLGWGWSCCRFLKEPSLFTIPCETSLWSHILMKKVLLSQNAPIIL